jgi:hypothetical protein
MDFKPKKRFPKKELNSWLRQNQEWNHAQWNDLLEDLKQQGFAEWTSSEQGRDALGLYLETHRR